MMYQILELYYACIWCVSSCINASIPINTKYTTDTRVIHVFPHNEPGRCRYSSDTHRYTPQYMYRHRTLSIHTDTLRYTPIHSTIHVSRSDAVDTLRYTRIHVRYTCITIGRCRYAPIHANTRQIQHRNAVSRSLGHIFTCPGLPAQGAVAPPRHSSRRPAARG